MKRPTASCRQEPPTLRFVGIHQHVLNLLTVLRQKAQLFLGWAYIQNQRPTSGRGKDNDFADSPIYAMATPLYRTL